MTERSRNHWKRMPKCWDDEQAWADWKHVRQGARSPCADCTPEYRTQMRNQLRCERPEVVFVRDVEGQVTGMCGDDPAYARVLMGLVPMRGVEIIGRTIERTEQWIALLKFVRRRAHRDVVRAIDIWMRRKA